MRFPPIVFLIAPAIIRVINFLRSFRSGLLGMTRSLELFLTPVFLIKLDRKRNKKRNGEGKEYNKRDNGFYAVAHSRKGIVIYLAEFIHKAFCLGAGGIDCGGGCSAAS